MIIKKSILKIAGLLMIVVLNWTGLLAIGNTVSTFNDTENSPGNTFSASTLYFSLSGDNFLPDITPSQNTLRTINISNDGSLDFDYAIKSDNVSGDLCSSLNLSATLGAYNYTGPIGGFDHSAGQFTTVGGNWQFEINLTSSDLSLQNKTCNFNFVFDGTQIGGAGFSDQETISNTVISGTWTITPPSAPVAGDVVINELMWMGSRQDDNTNKTSDEWIELRNMTSHDIDISNWNINNAVSGGGNLGIPASNIIPADGYFLIAHYNKTNSLVNVDADLVNTSIVLNNNYDSNGQLILKDENGNIIDATPIPTSNSWPAGINVTNEKWSMERNIVSGDGTLTGSWHTCDRTTMASVQLALMQSYWDSNAQNYNCGTPKNSNLSTNDSTAPDYVLPEETAPAEEVVPVEETIVTEETTVTEEITPIEEIAPIEEITAGESVDSPADDGGTEPVVETPAITELIIENPVVVPEVPADNPPAETAVQADNTTAE